MLEVQNQSSMNRIAEIFNRSLLSLQNDWPLIIRDLTLWLGVDSDQVQVLPDSLKELIEVPSELTGDWHVMGNPVPDLKFFQTDGINFVENVDARAEDSVTLNGVNEIIWGGVAGEGDISVDQLVLFANGSDLKKGLEIEFNRLVSLTRSSFKYSSFSVFLMIPIPPLSTFLTLILGGFLFNLIPNPSSSFSMICLCFIGL